MTNTELLELLYLHRARAVKRQIGASDHAMIVAHDWIHTYAGIALAQVHTAIHDAEAQAKRVAEAEWLITLIEVLCKTKITGEKEG